MQPRINGCRAAESTVADRSRQELMGPALGQRRPLNHVSDAARSGGGAWLRRSVGRCLEEIGMQSPVADILQPCEPLLGDAYRIFAGGAGVRLADGDDPLQDLERMAVGAQHRLEKFDLVLGHDSLLVAGIVARPVAQRLKIVRCSRCDIWALRVRSVMKPTHWWGGDYSPPPTRPVIFQAPPSLTKQSWAPAGDVSASAGTKPTLPDGATTRSHSPAVLAVLWESSSSTRTKCMPSFSIAGAVAFGVSRTSTSGRNG